MRHCVFSGSSPGACDEYTAAARAVGRELAARGFALVCGGANVGLMATVADTVLANDGEVIGVIPASLAEKGIAHTGLTHLRVVDSMRERKALMAELSDGAIALPGGLGTLEEIFEALTWGQPGLQEKPCGIINACACFSRLLSLLDHAVPERFLKPIHREMLLVAEDAGELLDQMTDYQHPCADKWLDRP
ncbi:MAG: LOG family protein [Planctomycetota bacterium]|jgi:uncharacterized protein (TIGR00730 family)